MTDEETLALLVEFKVWLVRALEDYLFAELLSAAKNQGRKLPLVTGTLLRTGATTAVSDLDPQQLSEFAVGPTWKDSMRTALESGAWQRLVDDALRLAFSPGPI